MLKVLQIIGPYVDWKYQNGQYPAGLPCHLFVSAANFPGAYMVMLEPQLCVELEVGGRWHLKGLYWSARAAIPKCQGLGGLSNRHLFPRNAGGWKS